MEITLVQLFVLLCMVGVVYIGLFGAKDTIDYVEHRNKKWREENDRT